MRIQRTSQLITGGVILLSALSIVCSSISVHMRHLQERAYETRLESLRNADQLAAGSDRLTEAVRGYAATGDRRYYDAYNRELSIDRTREKALERLKELGLSAEELALITSAKQNSDELVSLESLAIEAAKQGNLPEAVSLVFGDDYLDAKDSIIQPIAESRGILEERLSAEAEDLSKAATTAGFVAMGALATNAAAILGALFLFYNKRVVNPLATLNQNLSDLVAKRKGARIGFQTNTSEIGEVARSMEKYRLMVEEAEQQRWVKESVTEISDSLQGVEQPEEFGQRLLSKLVPLLNGGYGAFHLEKGGDGRFHFIASYGGDPQGRTTEGFELGEGLAGQAAIEKKVIVISEVPPDYIRISSGLGEGRPRVLAEVPITIKDRVLAVAEVASFCELSDQQLLLLNETAAMVALELEVLQRNLRTRELLAQVQTSEERTRLILESSAEGIFGVDTEGCIGFVNPAACRLLGFEAEEMIGQTSHNLIHHHRPDGSDYPVDSCPMFAAYKRGEASRIDNEFLWRKDGAGLPVEYGATPLRKDGEIVGAVISFTDITERKRAEQELRKANFLSDMALELASCGYWHVDYSDPEYYYQSERAARIVGEEVKPDGRYHLQNEWFSRLIEADPDLAQQTAERYQGAIDGKYDNYDATYAYKRPCDGRIVWLHAAGSLVRGEDGKAQFMYGVYQDITEAKKAEAEIKDSERRLRETEQFFRSVLELAPDGLMVVDASGVIQLANAQCERLFGYTRDELIGQPVEVLVPEDVREGHPALREKFHRSPETRGMGSNLELRGLRKDFSHFPVEIGLSPLLAREGERAQVAVSIRDITDRKEQEDALKQAKAKAEEATEMKSMFLANMSHEIRTPMNAIIGLSHLALKTSLNPKQRDYVSKVHNAGTSLLSIINDILDFSKIEAGKLNVEVTDFQVDEVISSVATVTAQKAHEKGLEFLVDVDSAIPEQLCGDPLRLGQVLTNLVNNSIKFTERGEIRLKIEQLEQTGEKVQLRFSIHDTGIGMTREQAARLFQPFSQADMSTTRKHGGTGLGLTICKRLVELMGGQIWLESEPGAGSTFTFTVWLGVGQNLEGGRFVPSHFGNLNILVVDDNPAAREILVESLEPLAERVDAVSSGPEAIAAIKERDSDSPYDVVFMDWRMPGMDGLQATRLIKNDPSLRKQPAFIIVTAFGREEVREEAESLQIDGFLVKPVTKSMLVDSLVNVFAPASIQDGSIAAGARDERGRLLGLRVLLAEDNEINQQIAVELLQGVGARVEVADHGREAVEKLFEVPFPPPYDLVLMDLQMPEMDGYQATTKIRSDTRFSRLPIIAMTAHATVEERERCLDSGMNDHLSKPIDPGLLYQTLERYYRPPANLETATQVVSEPEEVAPSRMADLPSVEGLDTQDGLTRVAGNRKLYLKLLRQFVDQQGPASSQIEEALTENDPALAERLAHTVKGVAGNLGAREVQQVAAALEKAIATRGTQEELTPLLEEFRQVLGDFTDRLRDALPSPPDAAAPAAVEAAFDSEQAKQVIGEMVDHLNQFDPGAVDCLEAHRDLFRSLLGEEDYQGFEKKLNEFAFADALARLEGPAKEKGILPS